jgi:hypothetical protein
LILASIEIYDSWAQPDRNIVWDPGSLNCGVPGSRQRLQAIHFSQGGAIMRMKIRTTTAWIGIATAWTAFEWGAPATSADDLRLAVMPAIQSASGSRESQARVQFVQWGRPYRYRYGGYYGPFYGSPYYAPYPTPFGTPYPTPYGRPYPTPYGTPYSAYRPYGSYGYPYPAYGYAYPAWGYPAYLGVGIRSEGVSFGAW